ncbi:tRNA lysidine(34) synthetase TilS, partial [Arthrobacter sp. H14]|uniref:tRNA lysidine(34) synthetase TilS n=1 Tax=Arthrobacter sp. H14 TaxID=1312959 RepID=UPI000687CD5D
MGGRPGYRADGRRRRLAPVVGTGRNALKSALIGAGIPIIPRGSRADREAAEHGPETPLVLVACSGGPDSLALAAVTAFFARRGSIAAGAVVVDHGLQDGSAEVAAAAADVLRKLELDPVDVVPVTVDDEHLGPEGAAREARYRALDSAAERHQAVAVLLGHTLDDQAESVLLGLARGSGTRSLAGIPSQRGHYLRPFLGLRRADTEGICEAEGLDPWHDPTNADPAFTRSKVRTEVLPFLEEKLGPGIAEALHRSATILAEDAEYLDQRSAELYGALAVVEPERILLPEHELRQQPAAMRYRLLALAAVGLGADRPSLERIHAVESLLERRGSAGPVQLAGKVDVHRQ